MNEKKFPFEGRKTLAQVNFCFRLRFSEKAFSFWASLLSFMLCVQVNWFLKRRRCLIGKDEKRSDRMLVVEETYLEIFLEMVFDDLLSV